MYLNVINLKSKILSNFKSLIAQKLDHIKKSNIVFGVSAQKYSKLAQFLTHNSKTLLSVI